MNPNFPVVYSIEIYYSFFNTISLFGGYLSIITIVFITIPITLFAGKVFPKTMAMHIKERKQKGEIGGKKDMCEDEITKEYLKRVSHMGIYNIYEIVENMK